MLVVMPDLLAHVGEEGGSPLVAAHKSRAVVRSGGSPWGGTQGLSEEQSSEPRPRDEDWLCGAHDWRVGPRRAASMVATSIFLIGIIAAKARFASEPPAARASMSVRGVICQDRPQRSLHQPQALSCPPLSTIAFQ
jgi:hypothetical protein